MCLPGNIEKIKPSDFANKFTKQHICFTNKKRIEINSLMMKANEKKKQKSIRLDQHKYPSGAKDPNSQDVYLIVGTPIIAKRTIRSNDDPTLSILNNETFVIKSINDETIEIDDNTRSLPIPIKQFQSMFNVAYAITCHKSQGQTYSTPSSIS